MPTTSTPHIPHRVLVIAAHPDDEEFTIAGTLAHWIRQGAEVFTVICTDGSRGSNDPDCRPAELAVIRRQEQEAASAILGVRQVIFLDYEDGTLQPTLELRRDLTRQIRRFRPDTVVCGDPTMRFYGSGYVNHPDHRAAADAALDAVFPSAGTRWIFAELLGEGLAPHDVSVVYLWGAGEPDTWVDISDTIDLKIRALSEHRSQVGQDWEALSQRIRARAAQVAATCTEESGTGPTRYAEAFRCLILRRPTTGTAA
ncbi:MAG: PIG-L family deacetylase [Chloroflexi bacterium]|nr:PIG-L family deacetylase [Chloroflexota bacterium]MBU1747541.1 PIG-L family deacetylase [Chloroflexota bacterium]MBU1877472.1 PIG-L family deacetylase [Chloroflexota bacterium]